MIKEVTMYTIVCDVCGDDIGDHQFYSGWFDKNTVEEIAMENDWLKLEDKHYCPSCFDIDDENDKVIIKQ